MADIEVSEELKAEVEAQDQYDPEDVAPTFDPTAEVDA